MVNEANTALARQIKDAEEVIKSYAYGEDLEKAMAFLKENDPDNKVLADADIGDMAELKLLNALYRADKAREDNDTEELQKIAEFFVVSKNKELRDEGINMLAELPEIKENPERAEEIRDFFEAAADQPDVPPVTDSGMSDDEIVANAERMDYIIENGDFQDAVAAETIRKAKKTVSITEQEGLNIEDENDLWRAKMLSILNEVSMSKMDDAAFASKDTKAQRADLKQDVIARFWSDLSSMAGLSALDPNADDETNKRKQDEAEKGCIDGENVKVKANQFFASFTAAKDRAELKAEQLKNSGKTKAASWLSRKWAKINEAMDRRFGTNPVEFGRDLLGYFSHKRGITNTAMGAVAVAGAMYSIPVGLAAAGAFALYQSFAPSKWSIYEKKQANYKAAVAKGDEAEIKVWSGWNGIRNAYKAIKANSKEQERFDRQRKTNRKYGLISAGIIGLAAPVIMSGGLAAVGLGLGAAATYAGTRLLSSGSRMTGANINAYQQLKEAKRQYQEDQTPESEKAYKKARTYFGVGVVCSGLCEWMMADHVAEAYNEQFAAIEKENLANDQLLNNQPAVDNQEPAVDNQDPAAENADTPAYDWKTQLQEDLPANKLNELLRKFTGIFESRAEIFGMEDKAQGLTLDNVCNNIAKAQASGQLPNDISVGETLYKYMKLIENTERVEPVPGTQYLRTILDADKQPMYWVDQEQMRALNDIILCGKEVSVSADVLGKSLARIADNGQYIGEGANVGVTHNRFVGFGRGEDCPDGTNNVNAWERVKGVVRRIVKPDPVVEDEVEITEPVKQDVEVNNEGVEVIDKVQDGQADDGAEAYTKFTKVRTDSNAGHLEEDGESIARNRTVGQGVVPNSRVNSGMDM